MVEKKTFKNPQIAHIYTPYDGDEMFERTTDDAYIRAEDGSGHGFDRREWGVEVTFTKKPLKFEMGEKVRSKYSSTYLYTVIGWWKDQVIVVDENDDEIEYFDDVDLTREV